MILYFGAKYTLIDPTLTLSEFGLAVNPVVEVLSAGNPDGRVHFALPVNVEFGASRSVCMGRPATSRADRSSRAARSSGQALA